MYRKQRRPTPNFKIPPPYNPIAGEQASLRQEGESPFCAMMQVAAEDTYDNYVICRGFDTRILKFVDYDGTSSKPGITVAKPFGNRRKRTYEIGEVYPALLPTQGNTQFSGFRQVTYTPPSPSSVNWRVGQNPGVVVNGTLPGGPYGGHPRNLTDPIQIMYDHNGKVVNWLMMDSVRRRHWIGYLYESYRGVVSGMWVVPSLKLDGQLPPFSRVYVYNIYKWNFGKIGATIRVEEDKVNNRWIALQQEYICPTSEPIDPPTPPPSNTGTESGVE